MGRERLFLEDIIAAADAITVFMRGQSLASFEKDLMVRSAVVNQLTVIGEAVAHLPLELRQRHPEIP